MQLPKQVISCTIALQTPPVRRIITPGLHNPITSKDKTISMNQNSRLVYSTDTGRVSPPSQKRVPSSVVPNDGIVRIGRETKGRKGKGVTIISGLPGGEAELKTLAARLKRCCGSGGSVKDGMIIIQGDHRTTLEAELTRQGYRVKLAGG
jgi:translation initiation factor 1